MNPGMDHTLSIASPREAVDVAALVNRAYRPAMAMGGWTHEAKWVRGPRTAAPQVMALMSNGAVFLTIKDPRGGLIACVQVSKTDAAACIGMLATDPALQGMGLGTRMLEAAERYAVESGMPRTVVINVLECRSELVAFYERRGYRRTGVVHPYPLADGLGVPVTEGVKVMEMAKMMKGRHTDTHAQSVARMLDQGFASQAQPKSLQLQSGES